MAEVKGKIYAVTPLEQGEGKKGIWKKQQIVVEVVNGKYAKKIAVEIWNDLTDLPYEIGKDITFDVDLESREYNGKWYSSIKGWKVVSNDSVFTDKGETKEQEIGKGELTQEPLPGEEDSSELPF